MVSQRRQKSQRRQRQRIRGGCLPCMPFLAGLASSAPALATGSLATAGAVGYISSQKQEIVDKGKRVYRGVRQKGNKKTHLTVELSIAKSRAKSRAKDKPQKSTKADKRSKRRQGRSRPQYVVKKNGKVLRMFSTKEKAHRKYRSIIEQCEKKGYEKC